MGDRFLDWLFKYSNLRGSSKAVYDLYLAIIGLVVILFLIWLVPNFNVFIFALKVALVCEFMLIFILFRVPINKIVSFLCNKNCYIKYNSEEGAWDTVKWFFISLLSLAMPFLYLSFGFRWIFILSEALLFTIFYGIFRFNIRQYLEN